MVITLKDSRTNADFGCLVCGKNTFRPWGKKGPSKLYRCVSCGLVFFYPYPTQDELNRFYNENYHQTRGYDGASTEAGELRKKMYALDIADLKKRLPAAGGRFLDVGCAEGVFLEMLDPSWEKYGIDVSEPAINSARKKGINASNKSTKDFPDSFFEVIHLRGVFEHILDPVDFLTGAAKKIKPKGYLVISNTPNMAGLVPKLYRGDFRLVLPNEHVNYYSPKTMNVLMKKIGFTITGFVYPYFGSPYCSVVKDIRDVFLNRIGRKPSPPFYGNIFTMYAKKNF